MRAAVYLRISLDRTGEALGVDRQREACRTVAAQRGWTDVVEYVDNSVSASKARGPRSAYARLVEDARAGRVGAVIVWDLDRLTRQPREIEDWIDLAERGGVRLVTTDGEVDAATENGRMYLRIKGATARHEIEQKARRQRAAHEQRRNRGLPPSGKRALGWEADGCTLVPGEARAVVDGAATLLAGGSLRSVARSWTDAGLATADGRPWAPYSVRGVLLNPRAAGLLARRVGRDRWDVSGPGKWPALLPEEVWRAVAAVLSDPGRRTTPGTARVSLLSGLARCGVDGCGRALTTGGTRHGKRTLKCLPVPHLSRAAEPIEGYVSEVIVARLSRPDAVDLLRQADGPDVTAIRSDLLARRSRRRELAGLLADGVLTVDDVRSTAARLDAEVAELEAALADAGRVDVLAPLAAAGDVRDRWAVLDLDARRAVISVLCTVTVLPAGRGARVFDPRTVLIEPRE